MQLLDRDKANSEVDNIFLRMFAEVAGEKWPSLAALLSHTANDIEELESEQCPALCMLRGWRERVAPTYGYLLSLMNAPFLLPGFFKRLKPPPRVLLPSNFGKSLQKKFSGLVSSLPTPFCYIPYILTDHQSFFWTTLP